MDLVEPNMTLRMNMRYYIRKHQKIEGPLTVEEINSRIASTAVDSDWGATSDLGEAREGILNAPPRDWFPITDIPGIVGLPKLHGTGYRRSTNKQLLWTIILFLLLFILLSFFFRFLNMFPW